MKKAVSVILTLMLLFTTIACAKTDYTIKYIKSDVPYDYGSDTVYIARYKDSNKIIPLSIGPMDGYSYAYLPADKDFVVEKVEYKLPFNDLGEDYNYAFYLSEISARNIVNGFEDGSFRPDKELTRAEMATIFARTFDVPLSNAKACFEDVATTHWANQYIMALVQKGVFVKDTNFNPDSYITREQLVAMTHRMLSDLGYAPGDTEGDFSKYKDMQDVSEYALIPYKSLINDGYVIKVDLVDHDFMNTADDEYFLHPKDAVTRAECCEFLYQFIRIFLSKNAPAIRKAEFADVEIPILDGSTSTYDITKNIYGAFYHNYSNAPGFPKSHSKTTNSYKRLIDGEVEMIFVPDAGEDVLKYAEEKDVKLKFIPIANEAMVFFTDKNNPVHNITTEQLYEIYVNNSITNWNEVGGEDSALVAYCRNEDSGSHAQMEKFILNGKDINENIAKERTSVIMASILTDVDDYNRTNPGNFAIGYSLYYYYQNVKMVLGPVDLKLMSIDGVAPTDENIANSTYPYTTNYYAVIRDGEDNPKVDAFVELLQGEFGDQIAQSSGLGVIR